MDKEALVEKLKKKYVEEWKPTEQDLKWFKDLFNSLKEGGIWHSPALGVTYEKVNHMVFRLKSITTQDFFKTMIDGVWRIEKIGCLLDIVVETEKAADRILVF